MSEGNISLIHSKNNTTRVLCIVHLRDGNILEVVCDYMGHSQENPDMMVFIDDRTGNPVALFNVNDIVWIDVRKAEEEI